MKLKDELNLKGKDSQMESGAELSVTALTNIQLAQEDVNEFFGDIAGMTAAEFEDLELEEVMKIIEEFKAQSGILSFLKSAGRSV